MYFVHFTIGECFFLRHPLTIRLGATSFELLWIMDDTKHPTFQVAVEHWDYYKTMQNGTRAWGKHVSIKTQRG